MRGFSILYQTARNCVLACVNPDAGAGMIF